MNEELKTVLEGMEKRLDTRLTAIDGRFDGVESSIADLGESLSALATHIDKRFDEIQPILNKVESHETRLRYLEDKLPKLATN